jgi:Leucine-rich repeat (LRR) protein
MCKVHKLLPILCLLFTLINAKNTSSCILNTPCKCQLTKHSFTLINCSHSLPDLPIFNSNTPINITRIIARNALIRWPSHLCKYSNIQILDLSGSYFDSEYIDLSCLSQLIHLNLSNTQLKTIPNFQQSVLKHLQILDLSNNKIQSIEGHLFRSLNNLLALYIQNNPLEQIDHFEGLFRLPNLQFINLISSTSAMTIKRPLTRAQWINLANKWNSSNKSFVIRTNTISLQSILPNSNQFPLISLDLMKIIFKTLSNSTFTTLTSTPKCNCFHLQNYQRVFSFTNYDQNLAPLFQSSTCLLPNGIIHAYLFDRRTFTELNCSLVGKNVSSPLVQNSCSLVNYHLFIQFFIFNLLLFIQNRN